LHAKNTPLEFPIHEISNIGEAETAAAQSKKENDSTN